MTFLQGMVLMKSVSGLIGVVSVIGVSIVFVVGAVVGEIIVIGEFLLMMVINVFGEAKWSWVMDEVASRSILEIYKEWFVCVFGFIIFIHCR